MTAGHAAGGYHLWLAPEGEARDDLQEVIDRLAEAYGGPTFTPHVTLLSGLDGSEASLLETNRKLAAALDSFHLELTTLESGTTFFQCVYMQVGQSPSLSRTRQAAGEAFGLPAGGYMPHLSLYYGDASQERRTAIVEAVPPKAKRRFAVEAIQLIRADSERPIDWHCIERSPLGSGSY